ncbi:MAG: iron ABC transporter permease, partial [Synechococcaceae cyanobacterium SM2_3_60]|nr:iron ABC transporter permease [Synechococcaceae cyanobacterium SM2_3_60]
MRTLTPWTGFLWLVALILSIPLLMVVASLAEPATEVWQHFGPYGAAGLYPQFLGFDAGGRDRHDRDRCEYGLVSQLCSFPGRGIWAWALLLPLAAPAYVLAYTYTDLLDFAGPVQSSLRAWFGWALGTTGFRAYALWGGAIAMLVLVWYPYVYL